MIRMPLTPKVGEVPPESEKFASWSNSCGYYTRDPVQSSVFQTEKQMKGGFTKEDLIQNRTICNKMFTTNKSQVEFKGKNNGATGTLSRSGSLSNNELSRTMLSRTSTSGTFIDHKYYRSIMEEQGSMDNFEKSFFKYIKPKPTNQFRSDVISLFDLDLIVKDCLGENVPEFMIDKFKELGNAVAVHGEIIWTDFQTVVERVYKAVDSECKFHNELPPLILLMNKPKAIDKELGALGDISTTYRDNFVGGSHNSIIIDNIRQQDIDYQKPVELIGNHLNPAAKLVLAGTAKSTEHLPGYSGHIPRNNRNIIKAEHACGQKPRPLQNDLILTQRGMGCVLGYTGYVPIEFNGPRLERMTSCDPRTSNGAAYGGTKTML